MKKQRLTVISFSLILLALLGGLILCSGEESLAAEPGNELSLGSRGEEVGMIQKSLAGAGYYPEDAPSEYFGLTTLTAVLAFEKASGLPADGVIGDIERQLLMSKGSPEGGESVSGAGPEQSGSEDAQPGFSQSKLKRTARTVRKRRRSTGLQPVQIKENGSWLLHRVLPGGQPILQFSVSQPRQH